MTTQQAFQTFASGALGSLVSGGTPNVDYLSDTIKVALLVPAATPDILTHDFWNDLSASDHAATGGYTAAGATLASKVVTAYTGATFPTTWAATTAYTLGTIVRPTAQNGYLYQAVVAGTSAGSQPTWPTTVGLTVVDGTVTWQCVGKWINIYSAANISWASSTLSAGYAVVYDSTPGTDATRPLMILIDFQGTQSTNNTLFSVNWPLVGGLACVFYQIGG